MARLFSLLFLLIAPACQEDGAGDTNAFAEQLRDHVERVGAVGGVLYVLRDGDTARPEILAASAVGSANLNTGRAAHFTDLFRYASISKT